MSDCKRFPTGWLCVPECEEPAHDEFLTADYPTREERYAATVLPFIRKVCTCHLFSSDREPHNAGCETLVSARRLAAALVATDPAPAQPDAALRSVERGNLYRDQSLGLAARAAQPVPAPERKDMAWDNLPAPEVHLPGCQQFPTGWLCVAACTTVWKDNPAPEVSRGVSES